MSNHLNILTRFETYERIRDRMLNAVPDDIDKSENSFIYNAVCPIAYELYRMSFQLQCTLNSQFVDTAEQMYLSQLTKQGGVPRLEARPMEIRVNIYTSEHEIDMGPPLGQVYRNGVNLFKVVENGARVVLQSVAKKPITLEDTWSAEGFHKCHAIEVLEILQKGGEIETDDELRQRYNNICIHYPFGGNPMDYRLKIKEDSPEISHVKVVTRKEIWTDHNVEIYLLKNSKPILESQSTLLDYAYRFKRYQPIGAIVKYLTPVVGDTHKIKIYAQVPIGTNKVGVENQIKHQVAKFNSKLLDTWEMKEEFRVYGGQILAHLANTVPALLNIQEVSFENGASSIQYNYNELPDILEDNISIVLEEV